MLATVRDYYKILGVGRDADKKAIKAAYRRLARRYHPDVAPGRDTANRFIEIQEAYEVVSQLLGLRRDEVPHVAWQSRRGGAHGRGAVLRGLDRLLRNLTQLPVRVAEDPLTCARRVGGGPRSRSR